MYKLAAWQLPAQSMQVAARAAVHIQPRTLDWLEACRQGFLFRLRVQSVLIALLQSRPREVRVCRWGQPARPRPTRPVPPPPTKEATRTRTCRRRRVGAPPLPPPAATAAAAAAAAASPDVSPLLRHPQSPRHRLEAPCPACVRGGGVYGRVRVLE